MGCVKRRLGVREALVGPCDATPLDPVDVLVGSRLRRTRMFREISRRQLARRIGATERQVEAFESGATRIDAYQVRKIGRALAVRPSFLLQPAPRDPWDLPESAAPSPKSEARELPVDGSAAERVQAIFESIANPRIRQLLVDLMLVITAGENGGRRLM